MIEAMAKRALWTSPSGKTRMPRLQRDQPDEVADAVVWLLSDEARFVTGHTLAVNGGVCAV